MRLFTAIMRLTNTPMKRDNRKSPELKELKIINPAARNRLVTTPADHTAIRFRERRRYIPGILTYKAKLT